MVSITKKINDALFFSINDVIVEALIDRTPMDTGDTAGSWELQKTGVLGSFILSNPKGRILGYLEEGTKAHTIKPKTKKMLKFEAKKPPKFKNPKDNETFIKEGKIFFYSKNGVPLLGYVKEGSKIFVLAKKVEHPGMAGRHFIKKTLRDKSLWDEVKKLTKARLK